MRFPLSAICAVLSLGLALAAPTIEEQLALAREAKDVYAEIELLRRWLDAHPGDPAATEELVGLWLGIDDFSMAQQSLAMGGVPEPGLQARTLAEIAMRRDRQPKAAITLLRDSLAASPRDRKSRLLLAAYLGKAGEWAAQISELDALIREEATADLLLDRAEAKLSADDPKGALADFRKAAAITPDAPRVQGAKPGFERLEAALPAIAALDRLPPGPATHFNKAFLWFSGGVPKRGLSEAREGLRGWPDSVYGKILEARGLVATGSLTAAEARDQRRVDTSLALEDEKARQGILKPDAILAKNPSDIQGLINRGSWLNYCGQYALAMEDISSVLAADPSNPSALEYAVAISLRQGNAPAATAYAQRLVSTGAPPSVVSEVFAGLAQIAFDQSNLALALDFVGKSLSASSNDRAWKLKAACLTRLGQPDEAAEALAHVSQKETR